MGNTGSLQNCLTVEELFTCNVPYLRPLFASHVYPWELISDLADWLQHLLKAGLAGFHEIQAGIWIGENVRISPSATLCAPCIIGEGSEIRPGAYLRGNLITGSHCILGNSCEYKNAILLDRVQTPHYNYVGDSVLGNGTHLGAGTICSNLKADGKNVVIHAAQTYETGLRKLGAMLGDGTDVGCSCVLNPGTVIGPRTAVYPLLSLRGVIPADAIVKRSDCIVPRRGHIEQQT